MHAAEWRCRVPEVHGHCHEHLLLPGVGDKTIVGCLSPADDGEARGEGGAVVSTIGSQLDTGREEGRERGREGVREGEREGVREGGEGGDVQCQWDHEKLGYK